MSGFDKLDIELSVKEVILFSAGLSLVAGFAAGTVFGVSLASDTGTDSQADLKGSNDSSSETSRISLEGVEFRGEPSLGNRNASIKIIEYTEFGCPFCSEWEGYDASSRVPIDKWDVKDRLVDEYVETGEVEFIQKNWPQPRLHPNSIQGHKIANCVYQKAEESEYWNYQGQLFDRRDQWMKSGQDNTTGTFRQISDDLGLDTESIMSCYSTSNAEEAREDQSNLIEASGRVGTPAFFIGNRNEGFIKITGAQPLSRMEEAINKIKG